MRLPRFGTDRIGLKLLIFGVPLVAFLVAAGATMAMSSTHKQTIHAEATVGVDVKSVPTPASPPAAQLAPTPTTPPPPNRADCNAIRGTTYLSAE